MRTARLLLLLLGVTATGYGGWLLRPHLGAALPWLIGGPLLHDALVAPLVGLVGLALGRLVTDRLRRAWITAGAVTTGTLLVIAVPMLVRPAPAPPNPGLQERDYPAGLGLWLAILWAVIVILPATVPLARRVSGTRTRTSTGTARRSGPGSA